MDLDFDLPGQDVRTLSEKGVECPLNAEGGGPLLDKNKERVSLVILGPESLTYRGMMQEAAIDRMRRASAGLPPPSFEEAQANTDRMLASCVVSWKGFYTRDGEEIPCTPETVQHLFHRYPNLRRQADEFQSTRTHFILAS